MKRKVIKLAQQTLVVSLPAAWCKQHGVKKGDELNCEPSAGKLVVMPQTPATSEVVLDGDAWGDVIKYVLLETYKAGHDRVRITARKPDTVRHVQYTLSHLLGFHLIEQTKGSLLIEDITRPDQDIHKLTRRTLLLVKSMLEDGIVALENNDHATLAALQQRDVEINKLSALCIRTLAKMPLSDRRMHTYFYQLEQLADDIKETFPKLTSWHIPALKQTLVLMDGVYRFFFERTLENAKHVANAYVAARASNLPELQSLIKKTVSLQELFLNDIKEHHGTA
ncbi:phosphate uptake regulator PhoU [Candidatus Woesearchaeota archaeon]|nr:phosphate uptake regulator PhoU [Candidatus Woesearchaeota archaeon]